VGKRPRALEKVVSLADADFWRGKNVLLTGHTGFKGGWLALDLLRLGARVTGYALAPDHRPALFDALRLGEHLDSRLGDLRDAATLAALVAEVRPDIVFHLAAQPLVRASYADPVGTFAINVQGSVHLLDAIRRVPSTRVVVAVTTDKVYRNREWAHPYREEDQLGGHDPYSASKAAAEIAIASYREAFLAELGIHVVSARAGNVIGGGDWSADRLIPDAVRAWTSGAILDIRRPDATRPWQHVIEPVRAYIELAERLWHEPNLPPAFNFGPDPHEAADVRTVIELARAAFGRGAVAYADAVSGPHEAGLLALDNSLARRRLAIAPRWPLAEAVARTMHWYREQFAGGDAWQLCMDDLAAYEAAA